MKNLFEPGRSAAQTCAQIRNQFRGKLRLKLAFEPDWHLTHGFRRSGGIISVDLLSPKCQTRAACLPVAQKTIIVKYVPNAETTQREHHKGDHRYGIKEAAGYARIFPSPTTTASPPT